MKNFAAVLIMAFVGVIVFYGCAGLAVVFSGCAGAVAIEDKVADKVVAVDDKTQSIVNITHKAGQVLHYTAELHRQGVDKEVIQAIEDAVEVAHSIAKEHAENND